MNRWVIGILVATLPGAALAQGKRDLWDGSEEQLSRSAATRIEVPRDRAPDPVSDTELGRLLHERFLSPFLPPLAPRRANPLLSYLPGHTYMRAFEMVVQHMILREGERHWRRISKDQFKDRYKVDPSYAPLELEDDLDRMRDLWRGRRIPASPRLDLGTAPAAPPRRPIPNLVENRFFTLDPDLRLRFNLREVVGIVIGEGPEDDYSFQPQAPSSPLRVCRNRSRLPRIQIRARGKLRIDQGALRTLDASEGYIDRYGGQISVSFLSRSTSEKLLTATFEVSQSERRGLELSLGLKKRF